MDAKLDRIVEQLKELPLLRNHQDRLEELAKQIGVAAALVDDVKKDQAEAWRAGIQGAPLSAGEYARLFKVKVPTFGGEFPRPWLQCCRSVFELYAMPVEQWVPMATFHMEGNAARWMMALENRREIGWDQFCHAVEQEFGADDYQENLRALMRLRQEVTVCEYRDQFMECMGNVMLFSEAMDKTFRVTLFVMGLQEEIRYPVMMHFPESVTDAARLALLKEEAYDRAMQRAQKAYFGE